MTLRALLLALSLSGCMLWSDFKAPESASPRDWATTPAGDKAQWPEAGWWKAFRSPALTAQIDRALAENFDIKVAVARVQQADAQSRASGAPLLPTLDGNAQADRSRRAAGRVGNAGIFRNYLGSLSAAYELDFWGKNKAGSESAEALARAGRFDQQTVRLTTLSGVANTYFDILGTKERLRVARENLSNAQALLDTIRKRFNVGVGTELDLAQQESVVATQRATIPPLEQRLRQSLNAQSILLAKLPEEIDKPGDEWQSLVIPAVGAGLPSELLQRRPDVQAAQAQLEAAHADIIAARAAFYPSIRLTAEGGYQSQQFAQMFQPDSILWSAGSSLAQPIFRGGQLQGNLELKKGRYEELLQTYRKTAISAYSDVEDALIALQQAAAGEKAQLQAVATARKAYGLTRQQLAGGIIDIMTVLNTQRTLFAAEDALVQSRIAHLQAVVGLYRALGGGWQKG